MISCGDFLDELVMVFSSLQLFFWPHSQKAGCDRS